MMRSLKRTAVLVIAAGVFAMVFGAGSAFAKPCWKRLIDDWYDGRIDNYYPYSCVRAALKNAPEDLRTYSDLQSDLTRMLQTAQVKDSHNRKVIAPNDNGHNSVKKTSRSSSAVAQQSSKKDKDPGGVAPPGGGSDPAGGPVQQVIRDTGPSDPSSVPIPLIALGSLAVLLVMSGLMGLVARRIRARRGAGGPPAPGA
jgi:hypothetical protein